MTHMAAVATVRFLCASHHQHWEQSCSTHGLAKGVATSICRQLGSALCTVARAFQQLTAWFGLRHQVQAHCSRLRSHGVDKQGKESS